MDLVIRTLILLLISCIAITIQNSEYGELTNGKSREGLKGSLNPRLKRAVVIKRKTGPIRQVFGLIYEQWNDTKSTYNSINTLINDNFLPENVTTTTAAPDPITNVTVKPPPYKVARSEFYRILRRNLRGLVRLYNIELQDALRQSKIADREYSRNLSREVSKFL